MTNRKRDGKFLWGAGGILAVVMIMNSCGINMMPTRDAWYTQHYPLMQDYERNLYRTLSEAGRLGFQELFWTSRYPDAIKLFQERLDFIVKAYKRENARQPWNTDRGRIYILNGPPAAVDIDQNTDWGAQVTQGGAATGAWAVDRSNEDVQAFRTEIWTYSVRSQYAKYVFVFRAPNEWKLSAAAVEGNQFISLLENYNKTVTFGPRDEAEYRKALDALEKKK